MYKISDVAKMSKITVRTLHYYDELGILKPLVDENGYRLYSDKDIIRLQQILFFRELDFSLKEIKSILESPNFNRKKALLSHKEFLIEKKKRIENIINTVDLSLQEIEGEIDMKKEEMFNGFSMKEINEHKKKYANEVKAKYGESTAYKESEIKTSKYNKEEWDEIMKEANDIYVQLASYIDQEAAGEEVQEIIEKWRDHITKNYYNCTLEIFEGLAELYVSDNRFTKNIDKFGEGLAEFLSKGIKIYCKKRK